MKAAHLPAPRLAEPAAATSQTGYTLPSPTASLQAAIHDSPRQVAQRQQALPLSEAVAQRQATAQLAGIEDFLRVATAVVIGGSLMYLLGRRPARATGLAPHSQDERDVDTGSSTSSDDYHPWDDAAGSDQLLTPPEAVAEGLKEPDEVVEDQATLRTSELAPSAEQQPLDEPQPLADASSSSGTSYQPSLSTDNHLSVSSSGIDAAVGGVTITQPITENTSVYGKGPSASYTKQFNPEKGDFALGAGAGWREYGLIHRHGDSTVKVGASLGVGGGVSHTHSEDGMVTTSVSIGPFSGSWERPGSSSTPPSQDEQSPQTPEEAQQAVEDSDAHPSPQEQEKEPKEPAEERDEARDRAFGIGYLSSSFS